MLSLVTPTHKGDYLGEVYNSLRLQNFQDWEWILLPNGPDVQIPEQILRDGRVRVVETARHLHNVGALKRRACDAAKGDAFVEMDHDDVLVPGRTLQVIDEKIKEGAGFVYSDAAVFRYRRGLNHFGPYTYATAHGWQSYPIRVYGRHLLASQCFDVTPRSLAEIYYCPDHVRCWSRKAYYEAGGHNPDLPVCDDHELMIKTYLSGARFEHMGGCYYLYRMFDHNTVVMRNQQIQNLTQQFKRTHLQGMVQSWLQRHGHAELNLSELRVTGWKADRHLEQGFGHNTYGHIVADTELQWLSGYQVRTFMNEAWKALVPGGYLSITVPEVHSGMGYGDVEWKSHFSAVSMHPYTRSPAARSNGNIQCRFQEINCLEVYPSNWHREHGFKFLRFELTALKGQRQPGLQHI